MVEGEDGVVSVALQDGSGGLAASEIGPSPERRAFVKRILAEIQAAKAKFRKDFDRMRRDMEFVAGDQWKNYYSGVVSDEDVNFSDRYEANIAQRYIQQRVASLYARNPRAVAKPRVKILHTAWDGSSEMLLAAQKELAMVAEQAAAAPPVVDPATGVEVPLTPQMLAPNAAAIVEDHARVTAIQQRLRLYARTLEILYEHQIGEQGVLFKQQMKQLVRRALVTGVGYVKVGFQRTTGQDPSYVPAINDVRAQLSRLERVMLEVAKGDEAADMEARKGELQVLLQQLQAQSTVVVREGLTFDFPSSLDVIPAPQTRQLQGWVGAPWVAQQFLLTVDEVKEIYGVDVAGKAKMYAPDQDDRLVGVDHVMNDKGEDNASNVVRVYARYDENGIEYHVCEGYDDFLREPSVPSGRSDLRFPIIALVFNPLEHHKQLFPLSDATLLRAIQMEYNTVRDALKDHRRANRPRTFSGKGKLDEDDLIKITRGPAHSHSEVNLNPGERIEDVISPYRGAPIDPALYDVSYLMDDLYRVVGAQELDIGGLSGATATEAQLASQRSLSAETSQVDDLDTMLTEMARVSGIILQRNMSAESVKMVVGPGAVWPAMTEQELESDVYLTVQAGSSGRPNKAVEISNFERMWPVYSMLPLDPVRFGEYALRIGDDSIEPYELLVPGGPSIQMINGVKQLPTGNPATDPNAQGGRGGDNAKGPVVSDTARVPATPAQRVDIQRDPTQGR